MSDLNFLLKMGDRWENLYVPDQITDSLMAGNANPEDAIQALIGSQNDPYR